MKLALATVLAFIAGPTVGLVILMSPAGGAGSAATFAPCQTSGPITGLTPDQAQHARTIAAATVQVAVGDQEDSAAQARAQLIALMTAATESTLHNYSNPTVPASELLPNDGPAPSGGDHDSVGLFQQRASWGPLTARMDPAAATRMFVTRLLAVPAWQMMPLGVAAQTVQQSDRPDRYAAAQGPAAAWLDQISASSSAADCGGDRLPSGSGVHVPPGTLPAGYEIPASATDAERRAVTFAFAQLGKPYVFGAAGPDAFDCSGLTMAAWAAGGIQLPHYTVAQYAVGVPVAAPSLLSPGDLIFIPGSDGSLTPPNPRHVGMYIGDSWVIEAPHTGDVVKIVPLREFVPVIGMRHLL